MPDRIARIIEILNGFDLIDEKYMGKIASDLLEFFPTHTIQPDDTLVEGLSKMMKYAPGVKFANKKDLQTLTLRIDKVDELCKEFDSLGEPIRLSSYREFKEKPASTVDRIKYCKKYGVPYKSKEGELFPEVSGLIESTLYLRPYYMKDFVTINVGDRELSSDEIIDIFAEFCSLIQNTIYEAKQEKFLIRRNLEDIALDIIKSNPNINIHKLVEDIVSLDESPLAEYRDLFIKQERPYEEEERDPRRR